MTVPVAALSATVRFIRESALRDAMAMCNRLKPDGRWDDFLAHDGSQVAAFLSGHRHARMQLYAELERMIAREAAPATLQPGYTSDGLEDS